MPFDSSGVARSRCVGDVHRDGQRSHPQRPVRSSTRHAIVAPAGVTDPTSANNSATDTDTLTPRADLSITKTDGLTTVDAGTSLTYTIVATNTGPSTVTGATVTDTFPPQVSGATWTCARPPVRRVPAARQRQHQRRP